MSLESIAGVSAASHLLASSASSARTEVASREQQAGSPETESDGRSVAPTPVSTRDVLHVATPVAPQLPTAVRAPDGAADTSTTPSYQADGEPTDPDGVGGPARVDVVV